MSALVAGHFILGSITVAHQIYRILKPYRFGIYGPSMAGKTTLDQYLTVPGDIDPIPLEFRTTHAYETDTKKYRMPKAKRKLLRWKKDKKSVVNNDIGGQAQFRNLWIEDMIGRKVEVVIYMVDHRVLTNLQCRMDAVAGFEYVVDALLKKRYPSTFNRRMKRKANKYEPKLFCLLINKMDIWYDHNAKALWDMNMKREHPIVYPFRDGLKRLRKAGIRAEVEAISAQHGLNVESVLVKLIEGM